MVYKDAMRNCGQLLSRLAQKPNIQKLEKDLVFGS